ncbi:MAG: CDGSH iron-sulfur domain-containing protein [Nitrospirae bacterium]|nr:CDGSH iron-sulfur domain-containing protein [Nitrospirota bacterium]
MSEERKSPYKIEEKKGEKAYCSCDLSKNMPHCDGSHKSTANKPYLVEIDSDKMVHICGCKKSKNQPFCDGTHKSL